MPKCTNHPEVDLESLNGLLPPCPFCVMDQTDPQPNFYQIEEKNQKNFICLKGSCTFQCFDCMKAEINSHT